MEIEIIVTFSMHLFYALYCMYVSLSMVCQWVGIVCIDVQPYVTLSRVCMGPCMFATISQ